MLRIIIQFLIVSFIVLFVRSFRFHCSTALAGRIKMYHSYDLKLVSDSSWSHIDVSTLFSGISFVLTNNIPVELSGQDSILGLQPLSEVPTPNIDIVQLDGGDNLGALLWAFTLFNGLFTTAGRPGDWILPILAKLFQQENEEWFLNYKDGYDYNCPPFIDAARFTFFIICGYFSNKYWIMLFDGDSFWGWSTGACLSIPAALISVSRDKRLTREASLFQDKLRKSVEKFLSQRMERTRKRTVSEEDVMSSFRINMPEFRSKENVTDRALKKLLRAALRTKPDKMGLYRDFVLLDVDIDVRNALQRSIEEANKRRELAILAEAKVVPDISNSNKNIDPNDSSNDSNIEPFGKDFIRF
eukprot:gene2236-4345_t